MLLGMVATSRTWPLSAYSVVHPSCGVCQKRGDYLMLTFLCWSHLNHYVLDTLDEIKYVFELLTM